MTDPTRAFILGAGFSKPARMPLATEVLSPLAEELHLNENDEMRRFLDHLREVVAWLSESEGPTDPFRLNIEQVFHYGRFAIEAYRLWQQLSPVGRADGPGTPWSQAEDIVGRLKEIEEALRDVILKCDNAADLAPINRWAKAVGERDAVLTFNYDTLVERALAGSNKPWNHGIESDGDGGIPVFKLHGSIDWIVADRSESFQKLDLLFDRPNANRSGRKTGHPEDDCRLWRCRTREQLSRWIEGRELQKLPPGAAPRTVGIAGLGAYKELHQIPGLGAVWARGMRALYEADLAVVIGFSMSDFDLMAQIQFAGVARARHREERPLRVVAIDPFLDEAGQDRLRRVFRCVVFLKQDHQTIDWTSLA